MAIEYQLKFADGGQLTAIAKWLRAAGFEDTDAPATFLASGLSATIIDAQDLAGRWKPLGFAPRIQIFFGHDEFAPYEEVVTHLVGTVALLLRKLSGDAALVGDNEVVLALRQRGELVLTSRDDRWTRPTFAPTLSDQLGESYRLEFLRII